MRGPQIDGLRREAQAASAISVADLIAYRQAREKLVERVGEFPVETAIGPLTGYAYTTPFDTRAAPRLRAWAHRRRRATCRRACIAPTSSSDVFGGGDQIRTRRCAASSADGRGVIVYLRDGAAGVPAIVRRTPRRTARRRARAPMARGRARRPDPERPRRRLDPAAVDHSRAPMSASAASASRSRRSSPSTAEAAGRRRLRGRGSTTSAGRPARGGPPAGRSRRRPAG